MSYSEQNVFADNVAVFKEIRSSVHCDLLQDDLSSIYFWLDCWQLRLSPHKCEALSITNKRCPITTTYTANGVPLQWSTSVRYLGLHITSNLRWSKHCDIIAAKATKCLNYLRHTLWGTTPQVKSLAFRCVVRPIMEYRCQLWNPFTQKDVQVLETIQRHAARWVCGSRWDPSVFSWTKSSDQCLNLLG